MNEVSTNDPPAALPARPIDNSLAVFLELIKAIPDGSPLRDGAGILRPYYTNEGRSLDVKDLWQDLARIALIASNHADYFGGRTVDAEKEKIISAFTEALKESTDHEKTLQDFYSQVRFGYEKLAAGPGGFRLRDDEFHYFDSQDIAKKYLNYLKVKWLGPDDKFGPTLTVAIHLADKIIREREQAGMAENVPAIPSQHAQHVFATVRVIAEYLAEKSGIKLLPDDDTILDYYLRHPIYRFTRDKQKTEPKTVADMPADSRASITAEFFSNRLHRMLNNLLTYQAFGAAIEEIAKSPTLQKRLADLMAERPGPGQPEASPLKRLLGPVG